MAAREAHPARGNMRAVLNAEKKLMRVPFSEFPGRHERHYRRRLANPLFSEPTEEDEQQLLEVQRLDHEELLAFFARLRELVQQAMHLEPQAETEVVLQLKEDLEQLYETAAGVAEDQQDNQQAIAQLLEVVMRAVTANTGGDALAQQELHLEAQARALHFALLTHPLVADLLHPESLIGADELVATLLSEEPEQVEAALTLFDSAQREQLAAQAQALLNQHDPQRTRAQAWSCLALLQQPCD